jgi:hypothetical protein
LGIGPKGITHAWHRALLISAEGRVSSRFGNYLGEGEAFGLSIVGFAREILRPNASPLHNRDAPEGRIKGHIYFSQGLRSDT